MMRNAVATPASAAPSGAYSQAVTVGGLLFTAGAGPFDPATGALVGDDVATQTAQTIANIRAVLVAGGSDLSRVGKVSAFLADVEGDFDAFDHEYRRHFEPPYPARTTVGACLGGVLIELDVVADVGPVPSGSVQDDRGQS